MEQVNNLLDQEGQVGFREAQARSRNTMVLDVRRYVFVVWMCTCQTWISWVWLRIVPVQLFCAVPHLITVVSDFPWRFGERYLFAHDQAVPLG